jgi:hypothetical protein
MTITQKKILQQLFAGGFITSHNYRYRLMDAKRNPHLVFYKKTLNSLYNYLRKQKGVLVIDLRVVKKCNGNTWIKKYYKSFKKKQ